MAVMLQWGEREEQERAEAAGSFSLERSEWSRGLILKGDLVPAPQDLLDTVVDILGITRTTVYDGGLQRIVPKADPQFPWMVADAIVNLQGLGRSVEVLGVPSDVLEVPLVSDSYGLWRDYDCKVRFAQRPYPVLPDSKINVNELIWYPEADPPGSTPPPGVPFTYTTEFLRYTLLTRAPRDDWVVGTQGNFVFETGGPTGPLYGNGKTAKGQTRQYLCNADVNVTWFGVPFRYIRSDNCYFDQFRGRVNQLVWDTPWYTWGLGELLYMGYSYREYVPMVAVVELDPILGTVTSLEKLCDVTFRFLETRRESDDTVSPPDLNHIAGGHNLQPWFGDRKFHFGYLIPTGGSTREVPSYFSAPVPHILFSDPDFTPPPLAERSALPRGGRLMAEWYTGSLEALEASYDADFVAKVTAVAAQPDGTQAYTWVEQIWDGVAGDYVDWECGRSGDVDDA